MTTLIEWLPAALFGGLILAGTYWLAYEMGSQTGYEHGRNDEYDLALLRERRMWAGDDALIRFATETTTDWSNK